MPIAPVPSSMPAFYQDPAVRSRLVEFLGGDNLRHATAVYITSTDSCAFEPRELRFPIELDWYLDRDLDIARSLADDQFLLFHLDIEYVNFDSPAEAYHHPRRAFQLQEPSVRAIESLLLRWGIKPLHLITGQGHHFVWKIHRHSDVAASLRALDPAPELVEQDQQRIPQLLQNSITRDMQQAFCGTGLVLEYIAHCVKRLASPHSTIPVELTAVHVGPDAAGHREIVSLDISEYGDPLHTRMIRMPFTNYLKPRLTRLAGTMKLEGGSPALRAIPLHEMDILGALEVRRREDSVRELATRACVRIPEQTLGTATLLEEYHASRLRHFHQYFYSARHDAPSLWPDTYARTPLQPLPPCVRHLIEHPNDRLLKPAGMQLVARTLLAEGWHPRHIAGFIRSKFEEPSFHWGVPWDIYDAGIRADFYVRVFTGLYETGLDRLIDFNCTSTQGKGFCIHPPTPGCCLQSFLEKLQTRQCH